MAEQDNPLSQSPALPTRDVAFDDLRFQVDQRLQIEPPAARQGDHFYTRLIGYLKGSSLIVKLPTAWNSTVPLTEGDNVLVRGFSGRIAYAFNADILKIRYAPYPYCHLSFPNTVKGVEIRKAVRVRVNIPTRVGNPKIAGGNPMEAMISDMSALGAQLESTVPLGEPHDLVSLSFRFWLQPNDYEVNFNATGVIQSARPADDPNAPGWQHGIVFQGMRSTETILLQNMIYEIFLENQSSFA